MHAAPKAVNAWLLKPGYCPLLVGQSHDSAVVCSDSKPALHSKLPSQVARFLAPLISHCIDSACLTLAQLKSTHRLKMRIPLSFTRKLSGLAPWCPNVGPDAPSLATPSSDKSTPSVRSLKFDCPVQPTLFDCVQDLIGNNSSAPHPHSSSKLSGLS